MFIQCDFSPIDFYHDSCTKDLLRLIDLKTVVSMAKFVKAKEISIPSFI